MGLITHLINFEFPKLDHAEDDSKGQETKIPA
jgi:hypothetical protein